jgi:hypothetical protein
MKAVNLLLAVMFVVFAFLQINDPDPVVWILIYGALAVVCVLAAFRNYPRIVIIGLLIGLTVYSFVFIDGVKEWFSQEDKSALFDDIAKMEHPYIEESREFLGLMICIIVLIIHLVLSRKRYQAPTD